MLFCLLEDAVEGLLYVFVARAFTWRLCWVRSKRQPEKSFLWERYFPLACWNSFQQVDKRHLLKISPCFLSFSAKCLHSFHLTMFAQPLSDRFVLGWIDLSKEGKRQRRDSHQGMGCWLLIVFIFHLEGERVKYWTGMSRFLHWVNSHHSLSHCNWSQISAGDHNQKWDIVSRLLMKWISNLLITLYWFLCESFNFCKWYSAQSNFFFDRLVSISVLISSAQTPASQSCLIHIKYILIGCSWPSQRYGSIDQFGADVTVTSLAAACA